jgi:hypothetical protein
VRKRWIVLVILVGLVACLCLSSGLVWWGGRLKHTPSGGPSVRIIEPHYGDRVPMERGVLVQSEARDAANLVTQVELWVDGRLQWVDGSQEPQGSSHLYAAQGWQPSAPGSHTLMVRALNSRGAVGQAIIVVDAVEGLAGVGPEGEEIYLDDITSAEYVVSAGDTIEEIAEDRHLSPEVVLELNPVLQVNQPLPEGEIVEVPFEPGILAEEEESGEEPQLGPQLGPPAEPPEPPESPVVVPEPPEVLLREGEPVELIVTNLTLSNLNPQPGEQVVVGLTIMNTGGTTAEDFSWAWDPGTGEGWILYETPVASLMPGDDVVLEMAYTFQEEAQYGGTAWADSGEKYDEPDEANNFAHVTVTVGQGRPSGPLNPIQQNVLGDLRRLLDRIRHGQPGLGGDGEEEPELNQSPAPPTLEVTHRGCELTATFWVNSSDALGFYLYRWDATSGGDFEQIAEFGPAVPGQYGTRTETAPQPGEYYYQVVASNEFGEGVSDVVREQVTFEECESVGCNMSVLELVVDGGLTQDAHESVYCYVALHDLPEERIPPSQDEFLTVDAIHQFAFEEYLGGESSRLVTVPSDGQLRVFAECWAWDGGADVPVLLGEFTHWHGEDDWDGSPLYGDGGGFRAQYHINRVTWSACAEVFEYPYVPAAAYNVGVAPAFRLGLGAKWTWVGQERAIEGFWILCDGEKLMWVDKDDTAMMKPEENAYVSPALPEWLWYPGCSSGCNLSVVAGYKDEPFASDPGLNSPPSDPYPWFGSDCAEVTVSVDTFDYRSLDFTEDCVETYGYVSVNGYKVTMEGLADPEIPLTMCEWDTGVWDVSEADYFDITVELDPDEPLSVYGGVWESRPGAMYEENGKICSGQLGFNPAPPEVWAMADTESVHYLVGQGEAGSCQIGFTLHPGTPSH